MIETSARTDLTLRDIVARPVNVPMRRPLATASGAITSVSLVLIDVTTQGGITGHAYLFSFFDRVSRAMCEILAEMAALLRDGPIAPAGVRANIARRFRLIGLDGITNMCAAGVDVACWDIVAKEQGLPLARLLGGDINPIRAYNSNGLGIMKASKAVIEAQQLIEEGFTAIKLRLGHTTLESDLKVVRAVRKAIPDNVLLFTDYNQGLTLVEARRRCAALDGEGIAWIEEPIRHDDYAGYAALADATTTPIQIGENFVGPRAMAQAIASGACDYVMPDLERIGGVSGWLEAAALANTAGIPMSTHLFPEVSAQLMCVTATAHFLEYVDWACPILAEPLRITESHGIPAKSPGVGLAWNEAAVTKHLA